MYYRADAAANTFQSLLPEVKDVKQKPNEIDQVQGTSRRGSFGVLGFRVR